MKLRWAGVFWTCWAGTLSAQDAASDEPTASYGSRARAHADTVAGTAVLKAEQAQKSAGALGEPVRALTALPGVARAGFDSGALIIWGSTDAETRAYIDGVELPVLFHPGGFRSALQPAFLDTLTLVKGAPAAEYGRALGGVVEVSSRTLLEDTPHATAALDTLDMSAAVRGDIGPMHAAWGGRLGYIDRLARLVAPRAGDIVPVPEYADGFGKLQLDLPHDAQLSAVWLGTHDVWQRGTRAIDPGSARTQTQRRGLQLGYLRYERRYADGARIAVTPFVSFYDEGTTSRSGEVPWLQRAQQMRYGLRASYTWATPAYDLQLGLDALVVQSDMARAGTLTLPPREGDISVFGQPPGRELTRDRFGTVDANVAPYASLQLRWGRFTITPGVRLDIHALTASRILPERPQVPALGRADLQVRPQPRVALRYFAAEWLALGARAAITHQASAPADRSAVFGNPTLGLSRALTIAGGPQLRPWRGVDLALTGYYKTLADLPTRNPAVPLPLTAALLPEGTGRSYGAELALQLRAAELISGQLSYTLSRSRRSDATGPERAFDYDQTHVLTGTWTLRYAGFSFGGRVRVATGSPRTQVVGAFRNLQDDRSEPIFGAHNQLRLPTFFALDLRLEHSFTIATLTGSLWLDVLNVTNQRNVEDIAYRFDYQAREDITGLPSLAVLGVSASL